MGTGTKPRMAHENHDKFSQTRQTDHDLFYVLLTVHLGIILVNNQHDAQLFSVYIYFDTLHVSSNHVLIIRRINFINTTFGMSHL